MTTTTQNGTVYDNLLSTIEANEKELKGLNKDIDRMQSERFKLSTEYEKVKQELINTKAKLTTSNIHLFKFLDEMEGRFDLTNSFDSPEICRDYMDAANFTSKYFGRTKNRFNEAKHWYDNYNL